MTAEETVLMNRAGRHPKLARARHRFRDARLRLAGVLEDEWASEPKVKDAFAEYGRAKHLLERDLRSVGTDRNREETKMREYDRKRRQLFLMRTRDKVLIAAIHRVQREEEKRVGYPLDRQDVVDRLIRLGVSAYKNGRRPARILGRLS